MRVPAKEINNLKQVTAASSADEIENALNYLPMIVAELEERRRSFERVRNAVLNTLEHYAKASNWRRTQEGEWKFVGRPAENDPAVRARAAVAAALLEAVNHELLMAGIDVERIQPYDVSATTPVSPMCAWGRDPLAGVCETELP